MGREIRMVPPNWDHPKVVHQNGRHDYQPMRDESFENAAAEWKREFAAWERGEYPDYAGEDDKKLEFWEWHGNPPDRKYYRTWDSSAATWFQVWETVSEGTPVSPPFATREELVEYLVANGDFWDQRRRRDGVTSMPCGPWNREEAERFVFGNGWLPSMMLSAGGVATPGHGM